MARNPSTEAAGQGVAGAARRAVARAQRALTPLQDPPAGHHLPAPLDLEAPDRASYRDHLTTLARSARKAGRGAVISGQWLADTIVDLAPRIPVRDAATLARHHDGLDGPALAESMIRASGRVSATIGAAAGGLIAVQELSVAGAVAIPFELAAETALVVLVELKLVAELHQVAGRPLPGKPKEQIAGAVRSWLSGRGVSGASLIAPARADLLGRATRARFAEALRRRLTRNLTTLAPMMAGSAVAGWLNRRATLAVGREVADDLGLRPSGSRWLAQTATRSVRSGGARPSRWWRGRPR